MPDLLALDLETLRTLDHPVLTEVVADLRGRAEQPREMLWGFNNAF
ncbi:FxSxx-COOH cyclophane-containing RiPP peptide [Streptomyces sp. NPDC050804]